MKFKVLGPVQVEHPFGGPVALGPPKRQLLLAVLLCHVGQPAPVEFLMEALWEAHRPPSAEANLRSLVQQLRANLGAASITHDRRLGYTLEIDPAQVDRTDFARLVDAGGQALDSGDAAAAGRVLRDALSLWRGEPFGSLGGEPALRVDVAHLTECRLNALEYRIEADLTLGLHRELINELTALVAHHPLRESLHAKLMLALYRSGRQAEALRVYRVALETLSRDLGVAPGPDLAALHQGILRTDPDLVAPPRRAAADTARASGQDAHRTPTPASLPPDTRTFTGRVRELATLDEMLASGTGGTAVISAIHGMGGIGKTALAVHWAHRVRPRFPDGQLYLDLRGYAPGEPVTVVEALRRLLYALGVSPVDLPADVDDAIGLYRSLLADRHMLVLLDNARDSDQVRHLLPGGGNCFVLITSRDRLGGLVARHGARGLPLDLLDIDESVAMLAKALGGQRPDLDDDVAREISERCGRLPLALGIAAANLVYQPGDGAGDFLAELRTGSRLGTLQIAGEPDAAVRHAFDLSYRALTVPARRLLCLLSAVPVDVTVASAAALSGTTAVAVREPLDELVRRHLVQEHRPGRFGLHDLVREYAADRAGAELTARKLDAAYAAHLNWYATMAAAADSLLRPSASTPPTGEDVPADRLVAFPDQAAAVAWFDSERDNLAALLSHAARSPDKVWRLALAMRGWLQRRASRTAWIELYRHGIAAARDDGAQRAEAMLFTGIAIAHSLLLQRDEAVGAYRSAIDLFERVGDEPGRIDAVASLGGFLTQIGELDEALRHLVAAHASLDGTPDDPDVRFKVEMNLGYVHRRSGDPDRAMSYYRAAATTAERSPERAWLTASVLTNMAVLDFTQGRHAEAGATFEAILDLARQTGDSGREAAALDGLAEVAEAQGRRQEAINHLTRAVDILRPLGGQMLEEVRAHLDRVLSTAATPPRDGERAPI